MHFVGVLLTITILASARSQNSETAATVPNLNTGNPKQSTLAITGLKSSAQPEPLNSINPQTSPTALTVPLSPKVTSPDTLLQPTTIAQSQEPGQSVTNGVGNNQPSSPVAPPDSSVAVVVTQQPPQPSVSQGASSGQPASAASPEPSASAVVTKQSSTSTASPEPSASAVVTKQSSALPRPTAVVSTLVPVQSSSEAVKNTEVTFTGSSQVANTNIQSTNGGMLKSTAGPTVPPPETRTHVQIIFTNRYNDTFVPGLNTSAYSADVLASVAAAAKVEPNRISNLRFALQPDSESVVLIFTLEPFANDSCWLWWMTCGATIQQAVKTLRTLVEDAKIRLNGLNSTALYVSSGDDKRSSNYVTFQSWTDDGFCPIKRCSHQKVCDCKLTGELYCRGPNLLLLLLLLLLIPIIILIVLAVFFYQRKRKEQKAIEESKKNEKRVVRADMLSYHEYVTKEAEQQQPKVATIASRSTISESSVNTLFKSLGENLTIAYNGTSFIDAGGQDNTDSTSRDGILPK